MSQATSGHILETVQDRA